MPPEQNVVDNQFMLMVQNDLQDMKQSMSKIAEALTKIAVLEEKHQMLSATLLRVVDKLETLEKAHTEIRTEQIKQETTVKVAMRSIQVAWGVIGSGVLYVGWQILKMVAAG